MTTLRAALTHPAIITATGGWLGLLWAEQVAGDFAWPSGWELVFHLVSAAVALAVLPLRHRHPVAVATTAMLAAVSAFAVVPALVALYTVAAARERGTGLWFAGGHVVAATVGSAVLGSPGAWVSQIPVNAIFFALPVALGMVRRARQALVHELEDRATRAETEQQLRVEQARRIERERIAREMHDVVAHRISLVSLHAGALSYRPDLPPADVAAAGDVIRTSAHEALEELRGVIGILRDGDEGGHPPSPQPTIADVPALLDSYRAAGMKLRLADRGPDLAEVPAQAGRTAYRVLQEALTNVSKHAPRAPVDILIDGDATGRLGLEVANPLPLRTQVRREQHDAIPGAGSGLIGLGERVELAGGHLEHGPTDDGRYRLRAELTWTD